MKFEAATMVRLLEQIGIQVEPAGELIRFRGRLTEPMREAIRQHKPALLAYLRTRQ